MARRKLHNVLTWGAKKSVSGPSVEEVEGVGGSFEIRAGCVDLDDQLATCHVLVVKIVIYYVIYIIYIEQFWIL